MNRMLSALCAIVLMVMAAQARSAAPEAVVTAVNAALTEGVEHAAIISQLQQAPFELGLEDATAMAIEAGGEANADSFTRAGIAAAANLPEAESVAAAARLASGDSAAVDAALQAYLEFMDQPFIHHDPAEPTGGGAYNPQGPGGGTRPPLGGTRPPVSPAS
ncbi:hypothetical protein E2F43_15200 [Seongchinamella unica]|uniref:Uncharacterized protein n=1 Tax=Seongchinamella unica TaxID=2547392 RepID=A0A4R5LQS6_9GAMM|nr:hypothetical protein [Seongchinamella unica]TDG12900.1 hypothetical protein E2F43_15200 [Seongchinamella unica]